MLPASRPILFIALALTIAESPNAGGQVTPPPADAADSVITAWLVLVTRGAAAESWSQASPRFQRRIDPAGWTEWVQAQRGRLGNGQPIPLSATRTRSGSPHPEAEWTGITFAMSRAAGGRVLHQVWAAREDGHSWRVTDYAAWPDAQAVVNNAFLDPIPYRYAGLARGDVNWWAGPILPRPAPTPPRPAAAGTARANPATTRPRSPPGY